MTAFSEYMEQTATYWEPGVPDGTGGLDFSSVTPVLITCRWQDKSELFRDQQGREQISNAVVYPDRAVAIRGYLALGDHTGSDDPDDPREVEGAAEIRAIQKSPSLDGSETLHKVML